jgi:hypothetical protein
MACEIKRHDKTGVVENIQIKVGTTMQDSVLFDEIVKVSKNPTLGLLMWGVSNTEAFKSAYIGPVYSTGEPQISSIVIDRQTYLYFDVNGNKEFMTPLKVDGESNKSLTIASESEAKSFYEALETNLKGQPLDPLMVDAFSSGEAKKQSDRILSRLSAAYKIISQKDQPQQDGFIGTSFSGNGFAQQFLYNPITANTTEETARIQAEEKFKGQAAGATIFIASENKFLTKEKYIQLKIKEISYGVYKGLALEAKMELLYTKDEKRRAELKQIIQDNKDAYTEQRKKEGLTVKKDLWNWIDNTKELMDERLRISNFDHVYHQVHINCPALKTFGKADMVIVRHDGRIVIRDMKTNAGLFRNNNYLQSFFNVGTYLEATDKNKAKVQVMLYAIMMSLNDKNARFDALGVDAIINESVFNSPEADIRISKSDAREIIRMVRLVLEKNGQLAELESTLGSAHLNNTLNPDRVNIYFNEADIQNHMSKWSNKKRIDKYNEETGAGLDRLLTNMRMGIGFMYSQEAWASEAARFGTDHAINYIPRDIGLSVEEFVRLWSNDGMDPTIWNKDLSYMNYWLGGTTSNVRNPLVTIYNEYFHQQLDKVTRDQMARNVKLNELKVALLKKHFPNGVNLVNQSKITEFWNNTFHAYATDSEGNKMKYLRHSSSFTDSDKAEKEFLEYIESEYDYWLKGDNSFINQAATVTINNVGKVVPLTHLDVRNGKGYKHKGDQTSWDYKEMTEIEDNGTVIKKGFSAQVAMTPAEKLHKMNENNPSTLNKLKDNAFVQYFTKYLTEFISKDAGESNVDDTQMIPLRHLGNKNDDIDNYTSDITLQFLSFTDNMIKKKYMDNVLALAEAMARNAQSKNSLLSDADKTLNLANFIRAQARSQIKGQNPPEDQIANVVRTANKLFRLGISIDKDGKKNEYITSIASVIRGLKYISTNVILTLNFVSASYNAFQALFTSSKLGLSSSMAGSTFVGLSEKDKQFLDFGPQDFLVGAWTYWGVSHKKKEALKMEALATRMRYYASDAQLEGYDKLVLLSPYKALNKSTLYFAHRVVEDANAAGLMYAQMKKMMVTAWIDNVKTRISLWDLYDYNEETKSLEWKKNSDGTPVKRGTRRIGGEVVDITELTEQEIIKLKRVYERVQGNYREEEKSMLEMTLLGGFFLQFKRFLPAIIRNQFQSKDLDSSLGAYVPVDGEELENENGEMEWVPRSISGKFRTLYGLTLQPLVTKMLTRNSADAKGITDGLSWGDLSADEKTQMIDALISLLLWAGCTTVVLKKAADDKEDEMTVLLRRLASTIAQPISPFQTLASFDNLSPVGAGLLYKNMEAVYEFTSDISKKATGVTDNEGALKGASILIRNTPFGRAYMEVHKALDKDFNKN